MTPAKVSNEKPIMATDFKAKADKIIKELKNSVFSINEDDLYTMIKGAKVKRKTEIGEVKPICTSTKVACKLDELYFLFEPITNAEDLEPSQYVDGFREFMRLMATINDFIIMTANKQLFCGFIGITVDDYNNLIQKQYYAKTLKRIDDMLVGTNFISAESGLVNGKVVIEKMQSKGLGHDMVKTGEGQNVFIAQNIDKAVIASDFAKFKGLIAGKNKD